MKKQWNIFNPSTDDVKLISESLAVTPVTAAILISRGLVDADRAKEFLFGKPDLKDPFSLSGMEESTATIIDSVNRRERILIFGDYDVDGITSTALLFNVLKKMGSEFVECRIPLRGDGYGLSEEAVKDIIGTACDLVITVDNGIRSVDEIHSLNEAGIKVVVVDHHEPGEVLPKAVMINPKLDEDEDLKNLSGVGVTFKLAQALLSNTESDIAWLRDQLDLIALGTVADLVELKGENRRLVKEGLKVLDRRMRPGIKMLTRVAGIGNDTITAEMIAFVLAPRLNASGRVSNAVKALNILLTESESEAELIAEELNTLNAFRQKLEKKILEEACLAYEESYSDLPAIVLSSPEWHEGVVGIVASRLAERFFKPAILFSENDGLARGSARSIGNFDLYEALRRNEKLLHTFGGHKYAAGLTVKIDNLDEFREAFCSCTDAMLSPEDRIPFVTVDCLVELKDIDFALLSELELLEPFGYGNPRPTLALRGIKPERHMVVGNGKHYAFDLISEKTIRGIAFKPPNIDSLINHDGIFDLAFSPIRDRWNGCDRIQLKTVDIVGVEPLSSDLVEKAFEEAEKCLQFSTEKLNAGGVITEPLLPAGWSLRTIVDRRNEKSKREFISNILGEEPVFLFAQGKRNCLDIAQWLRVRRPDLGEGIVPIFSGMPEKIGTEISNAFRSGRLSLVASNEPQGLEAGLCKIALFSLPLTASQFLVVCSQRFGESELILLYNNGDLVSNIELARAIYPDADEIQLVREAVRDGKNDIAGLMGLNLEGKYTRRRISSALAILSEAGLIKVDGEEIKIIGGSDSTFTETSGYLKGLSFKEEVESFGSWALEASTGEMERVIATGQYGNKVFRRENKAIQP